MLSSSSLIWGVPHVEDDLTRYENTEAVGELCHCMGEKCNSGKKAGSGIFATVLTIVLALVA